MSHNTQLAEKTNNHDTESTALAQAAEFKNQMLAESQKFEFMERKAQVMASSVATIPKHLQGNIGDCMAIIQMADNWGLDPYTVAQKTFLVNGVLGFEGQLVNAVVTRSGKIKGTFDYEWFGDWSKIIGKFDIKKNQQGKEYMTPGWTLKDEVGLGIRISATLHNEQEPRVLELLLMQAQVRNSTLWASDPKQQLAYLGVRRWARLHAPDAILGMYTPDELRVEKDITPPKQNVGDEQMCAEIIADIEKTTKIEEMDLIKKAMIKHGDSFNGPQKEMLQKAFSNQVKFIKDVARQESEQAKEDS